jgi:alpha-glucosidase
MTSEQILSGSTRVRVQYLAANAVRVTHTAADARTFPEDRPWLRQVLLPGPEISPDECRLVVDLAGGLVRVSDRAGQIVLAEARPPRLNRSGRRPTVRLDIPALAVQLDLGRVEGAIHLALATSAGEGFYGWGERFDAFRRERGTVRCHIRDAIAMLQQHETYSAIPFFLSSRGYGFWLLNSHKSVWRIDPEHRVLEIAAAGPPADYVLIQGPSFRDILATYTQLTGRPPLLPRWALGLMVSGYPQEHQGVIRERIHEHRRERIPLDALILDYHWEGRFHNFQWRLALFPDPTEMVADLKAAGVRLGLILTPFVNRRNRLFQRLLLQTLARNRPRGLLWTDERDLEGYAEARERRYLAHPSVPWWFGRGGMVDFTNPEAAAWWNTRMRPLYEQGVDFFKNDDGEYLPRNGRSALGMDGREYHNLYGFFYGRALYEGMATLDERRPFIYARSVWAGSQRYPAMFLGDQKPTFACMRSTMRAGLNMGLAGFAYWTADIFGLDGRTTPETHMRYAQWGLFSPVARYFWRPPEIDDTRYPWSHNPEVVEANFRTHAELRYRLLPYYYTLAWEAYRTGLPILRPLLLEFPEDARLSDVCDEVLLGGRLLLAPVLESGATSRRIVLPAGEWHDFWSTESYPGGGEIAYPAPLDRLPILVRGGTILPLGPALSNIRDDHRFEQLFLHIWPPYPAQGLLYDDDGRTRAYQQGAFSVTRFSAEGNSQRIMVRISPAEGSFPEQVEVRQVEVILHRATPPAQVLVNGQVTTAWHYAAEEEAIHVPVRCPTAEGVELLVEMVSVGIAEGPGE